MIVFLPWVQLSFVEKQVSKQEEAKLQTSTLTSLPKGNPLLDKSFVLHQYFFIAHF